MLWGLHRRYQIQAADAGEAMRARARQRNPTADAAATTLGREEASDDSVEVGGVSLDRGGLALHLCYVWYAMYGKP